jgi:mannosyltransferase
MSDDGKKGIAANLDRKQKRPAATTGVLLLVVMLGMGLRLYELDADSLWLDEITTASQAQQNLLSAVTRRETYTHPPLIDVVTWFFINLSGDSDFVIRLQAMLFGSVSIALAYKMGELLWTRKEGMIAAFLLAGNAYHIHYSQEARSYALMVFLALFSLVLLAKALRKNRRRYWIGFILCTELSLYNHYFAFLFLPATGISAVLVILQNWLSNRVEKARASKERVYRGLSVPARQALTLCVSMAVVGLSYVPWLATLRAHAVWFAAYQGGVVARPGSLESSLDFLRTMLTEYSGQTGVGLLLWVGVLALGLATSDRRVTALMASCVGTPLLFLALVHSGYPSNARYVLFILPLFLLVIARGIASGSRLSGAHLLASKSDRQWALTTMTTLAVLAFASSSVISLREYYSWQKEDWRAAAAFLQRRMGANDVIIVDGQEYGRGGDAHRTATGLKYYLSLWDQDVAILHARQGLALRMRNETHAEAQVWGVLWHAADLANLDQVDDEIQILEFPWVTIVKSSSASGDSLEDTISILEALKMIQPTEVARFDLYLALAGIHREQGKIAQAASDIAQAESVRPEQPEAYIDLGNAYHDLTEPYKALAVYQQGLETAPQNAQLYLLLGQTCLMTGSIRDSVTAFERALAIDPTNEGVQRILALLSASLEIRIPYPLLRDLGWEVAFLGYDLSPHSVVPGGTVEVSVWWQALQEMERDYTMFIHVVGPEHDILVQEDRLLANNQLCTSQWRPGEVVRDEYSVRIPTGATPGAYTVIVGAYYWETGERLPVWDGEGDRLADDALPLDTITVYVENDADPLVRPHTPCCCSLHRALP